MKTLGVIGNSHLAALKLGWNTIKNEYPDVELAFFGKAMAQIGDIVIKGDSLAAANDDLAGKFYRASGRCKLSGQCDGYLVCDLGITSRSVVEFCRAHQPESFVTKAATPISLPCFNAALDGFFRDTLAVSIIRQIKNLTSAPIALLPAPMRSVDHPDPDRKRFEESGDAQKIADAFNNSIRSIAEDLNLRLFLQTGATLASPLRTRPQYTRAFMRVRRNESSVPNLREGHADRGEKGLMDSDNAAEYVAIGKDYGHMNKRYGAIMLRLVLENFGFTPIVVADGIPIQLVSASDTSEPPAAMMKPSHSRFFNHAFERLTRLVRRAN